MNQPSNRPRIILDTNILLNQPKQLGIVYLPVLRELDILKTKEGRVGKKARAAIKRLLNFPDSYELVAEDLKNGESVDEFLTRKALEENSPLATMDVSLSLIAKSQKVETINMFEDEDNTYSGVHYLSDDELANIYDSYLVGDDFLPDIRENQFLIHKESQEIFMVRKKVPKRIGYKSIIGFTEPLIKPRNLEQYCLTEMLESDLPVVMVTGKMGSGKSFLMLHSALSQVNKGEKDKIVFIPTNSYVDNSFDLAALPGDIIGKTEPMFGPLKDIIDPRVMAAWIETGKLEILPLAVARGRSFKNSIVYCSEAQNLTESHMMLLLSRIGEGSRIFIDGDVNQVDKNVFKVDNGMKLISNLSRTWQSAGSFGMVELVRVERSPVASFVEWLEPYRKI